MAAETATSTPPTTKKQSKSFEALTPELSTWILDYTKAMNFPRTTPVQGMAIPLLMGNKDLVVEVRSPKRRMAVTLNIHTNITPGCYGEWQDSKLLDSNSRTTTQSRRS